MNSLRTTLLAVAVVAVLGIGIFALPAALTEPSNASTIAFRVVLIFLLAIALGLAWQLADLVRARIRSKRIRSQISTEALILTAFWNPELWGFLGLPGSRSALGWALGAIAATIDPAGVAFWTGTREPHIAHRIPWKQVEEFRTEGRQFQGKSYPALGLHLRSGQRLSMQVATAETSLGPIAKWPELERISAKIAEFRP